jgi:hypothetical protein
MATAAGRVFALEMAFYVSTEMVSLLLGGALFDRLHLTTRGVAAVMACVGVCCAVSRDQGLPWHPICRQPGCPSLSPTGRWTVAILTHEDAWCASVPVLEKRLF